MAGAQRGSPSPSPTPSPNALCSGRWRLRMSNGLPSLTVPRHTTKTTVKKQGRKPPTVQKAAGRMASSTPPRVRKNIYLKTRPAPLPGKNEGSAKSTAKYKEPSSSALPGQLPAFPRPYSGYTASDESILSKDLPASISPYIGGTGSKGCPPHHALLSKDHTSGFWGMGEFEGEGPFFPPEKGPFPLKSISPLPRLTTVSVRNRVCVLRCNSPCRAGQSPHVRRAGPLPNAESRF